MAAVEGVVDIPCSAGPGTAATNRSFHSRADTYRLALT